MAKFYVGQRVRVVRSRWGYEGREGTVVGDLTAGKFGQLGWPVEIDGVGRRNPMGMKMVARDGWIEPIVDDGHKKVEWSECIFDREGRYVGPPVQEEVI